MSEAAGPPLSLPRRLSVIRRVMPPMFVGGPRATNDLRAYYYDRLWRQWSVADRLSAIALNGVPAASSADGLTMLAWRMGFRRRNLREIEARRRGGARIEAFLDQDERKGIHAIINNVALPLETSVLKNKLLFERACRSAGLPLPAAVHTAEEARRFPSLISKPQFGSKGKRVSRLVRQRSGGFRTSDGEVDIPPEDIAAWLVREHGNGRIVQECLSVVPSLAPISPGALPTLRIVTIMNEQGVPEVTDVALRLSLSDDRAADNFNIDNLVVPVDPASGVMGPALRRQGEGFAESPVHPRTQARIEGEPLPLLDEARALARDAHVEIASDYAIVGWDIGLTDRGPVLVEGNWNPGYNVLQLVQGVGLGEQRIGALYRYHLEAAPDPVWLSARPIQIAQKPF